MGCAVSCVNRATMSLFGKNTPANSTDRAKVDRKLYIAKESPEADFDLSDCILRQIPSGIFSLCKVYRKQNLYLHENNLKSLEEGGQLSDLYMIRVLNVSCNKFTYLPNDIRYLVNLTELYVQDNAIKLLPDSIQYLQNLQILDASKNRLQSLTPSLGKLKSLRKLNITHNSDLRELCPELCYARNLILIELDADLFTFPPPDIAIQDTSEIMKFLCLKMNIDYCTPAPLETQNLSAQTPTFLQDPFAKNTMATWEEQEAAIIEQENRIHEAARQQRDKFLVKVLQEQMELDNEISKVQEAREVDRQRLIKAIQEDEQEIECLVQNFIQSEYLNPEIIQQQLAHEQLEHDRLLEIARQNYDNVKKTEILKAMETLIEEEATIQYSKKVYEDSLNDMKQNILLDELDGSEKFRNLLRNKDESRNVLVQQLLEDQNIQKAVVASLIERVDARSWSLNQEIFLISTHLAKLSVIEQEKKKLQVGYNYNELLHQRVQLVNLLDDLFDQQTKRKKQLIDTLKEMENEKDKTTDFWLKNYQKLIDSAPKTLLDVRNNLDPILANYLLQEGVIHCLPFLVKFMFADESLSNITLEKLKENGVSLSSDREGIIKAINYYIGAKSQKHSFDISTSIEPSAPENEASEEESCTGVVNNVESEVTILESECVVCMDAKCEVIFVPCGHMCCCQSCGKKEMEGCPMCRSAIERVIKVIIA